jgi:hypothetical protein
MLVFLMAGNQEAEKWDDVHIKFHKNSTGSKVAGKGHRNRT